MQDSQSAGRKPASRRGFCFGGASVGAAAAAVTVLPKVATEPVAAATPALKPPPEKGGGYTLSEHVKHYYKTTSA